MKSLENPKTEYQLTASLESLHAESLEWINDLDFLYDEITFFYKLLHKNEFSGKFPSLEFATIERELIRINSDELDPLRNRIKSHESTLAGMLRTTSLQLEESYREDHKNLFTEIFNLNELVRKFKKDVFSFILRIN